MYIEHFLYHIECVLHNIGLTFRERLPPVASIGVAVVGAGVREVVCWGVGVGVVVARWS